MVELVADKVPAVDHVNDAIQTFVRPAAGGLVAVASSGQGRVEPWLLLVAGVLIAGGVHAVKAAARPVINAVDRRGGAPVVSTAEDVGAAGVTVMAFVLPVLTFLLVGAGMAFAVWAILRWRRKRAEKRSLMPAALALDVLGPQRAAGPLVSVLQVGLAVRLQRLVACARLNSASSSVLPTSLAVRRAQGSPPRRCSRRSRAAAGRAPRASGRARCRANVGFQGSSRAASRAECGPLRPAVRRSCAR